jgi:hypothetical protein
MVLVPFVLIGYSNFVLNLLVAFSLERTIEVFIQDRA